MVMLERLLGMAVSVFRPKAAEIDNLCWYLLSGCRDRIHGTTNFESKKIEMR